MNWLICAITFLTIAPDGSRCWWDKRPQAAQTPPGALILQTEIQRGDTDGYNYDNLGNGSAGYNPKPTPPQSTPGPNKEGFKKDCLTDPDVTDKDAYYVITVADLAEYPQAEREMVWTKIKGAVSPGGAAAMEAHAAERHMPLTK